MSSILCHKRENDSEGPHECVLLAACFGKIRPTLVHIVHSFWAAVYKHRLKNERLLPKVI